MKITTILFIFAIMFLSFLTLLALFPSFFTSYNPNEFHFPLIKPNFGINHFSLENPLSRAVIIDSFRITTKGKILLTISEKITLAPKEQFKGTFQLISIPLQDIDRFVCFEMQTKAPINELDIFFNHNDKPFTLFREEGKLKRELRKGVFIGKIKRDQKENRFLEKSIMGSDKMGRDIWTRLVYGTQVILQIVLFSLIISVPLGIILGLIHGYYNNFFSQVIGVFSNLSNAIPVYLLAMIIVSVSEREIFNVMIAFALVQWIEIERNIYRKVMILKKSDLIVSAKLFGKGNLQIIFNDILLLCLPQILIGIFFLAKRIILIEAGLSYIGYSVQVPTSSWGEIIAGSRKFIYTARASWLIIWPTLFIIFTAFSFDAIEKFIRKKFNYVEY